MSTNGSYVSVVVPAWIFARILKITKAKLLNCLPVPWSKGVVLLIAPKPKSI
jgi:hypothetical protein